MIYNIGGSSEVRGIVYLPLTEMFLGLFLFVCAAVVVYFYFKINGFSSDSLVNVDFLLVMLIFAFCFVCGKKLFYQRLSVTRYLKNDTCAFYSSLREETSFTLPLNGLALVTAEELDTKTNRQLEKIIIISQNQQYEFYKSVSKSEIETITNAVVKLLNTNS